jgi:thiamine-phosphate pyrophosphorylase
LSTRLEIPRLYVILDAQLVRGTPKQVARELIAAGVRLLQFRAKNLSAGEILRTSKELAEISREGETRLFVNDRPDLAHLAGADGVHVGQEDLGVDEARAIVGQDRWLGVSTHNLQQFQQAAATSADYIAIGPIFATTSKANPDPMVGTELIRKLRPLTDKPIVAIGGIRLENSARVIEAGADSVAVISDILCAPEPARQAIQFLQHLESVKVPARP